MGTINCFTKKMSDCYDMFKLIIVLLFYGLVSRWSLGCLLYEMSTFSHAFEAHCLVSILMKIIRGKYDITKIEKVYSSSSSSGSDTLKQTKEESNFDRISSNIEHSGSPSNDQEFTKTVFYDNLDSRYNVSPAPGTSNFATIPPVPTHLSVISRLVRDLLQLDPLKRMSAKAVCVSVLKLSFSARF